MAEGGLAGTSLLRNSQMGTVVWSPYHQRKNSRSACCAVVRSLTECGTRSYIASW